MSGPLYQTLRLNTQQHLFAVPNNTPIPDATNTPVDPTQALKTIVSDITQALSFLIENISYGT